MINEILDYINTEGGLLHDLCWKDNYGGLAKVFTKYVSTEAGIVKVQYPVKCNTTHEECQTPSAYLPLAPDSTKKSIFYFKQVGKTDIAPIINKGLRGGGRTARKSGWKKHTVRLRLYVWLNHKLLGYDGCSMCNHIYSDLAKKFNCQVLIPDDSPFKQALRKVKMNLVSINSSEETMAEFSQYSYANEHCLYNVPYELCSFDFELCYHFNPSCIELIKCAEPDPNQC